MFTLFHATQAGLLFVGDLVLLSSHHSSGPPPAWLFPLLKGVGVLCLIGGAAAQISTRRFLQNVHRTQGTVIRLKPSGSDGTVSSVFEYLAADGNTYECTSRVASKPPAHKVGQTIKVLYHPEAPEKARIDSFLENWFLPVLLLGVGAMFLIITSIVEMGQPAAPTPSAPATPARPATPATPATPTTPPAPASAPTDPPSVPPAAAPDAP